MVRRNSRNRSSFTVLALELPGVNPALADMVQTYGLRVAEQALQNFPLYAVQEEDLALADSLGLQPGAITVTSQGLSVAIEPKAAAPAKP